jgi:hypothetical protein
LRRVRPLTALGARQVYHHPVFLLRHLLKNFR